MATLISFLPNTVLSSPFPDSTRTTRPINPFFRRTHFGNLSNHKSFLRSTLTVARFGLGQVPLPDPESTGKVIGDLFTRAEALVYTIADAAVSASPPESVANTKQNNDWFSGIANYMETVLKVLKNGLSTVHTPYAYGFAIILLTVLVKAATFPLSKKQVESAMAMRSLAPQIKAIQQRYAGNQERIQLETARLYKLAGINPLAGCLPTLATIPVWIGLYRALSNVADEGLLTEGFFWIPSLAGPTTIAARQSGSGVSWLFPFVDGQPPLGWHDTLAYLVLPVLLVASQYLSVQVMQSTQPQSDDPNLKTSQAITKFLPLMIGYFSLSVPSGLSLYWLTNNLLSTAQQIWLQKMGGANNPVQQLSSDVIGKGEESKVLKSEIIDIGEESKMLKSVFENTATKEAPRKEKPASAGPRPGDRFRQLKEQEARRKQQEEERKRTEAAACKDTSVTNGEVKKELDSERHSVNGVSTSAESNKDQETSIPRLENGEVSVNSNDGRDQQQYLHQSPEKGKGVTTVGSTENKLTDEDKHQDRSE